MFAFQSRSGIRYVVVREGEKFHLTRSLVAFGGWSSVRDRTNRKLCPSHEIWSLMRVVVLHGFYCRAYVARWFAGLGKLHQFPRHCGYVDSLKPQKMLSWVSQGAKFI